MSVPANGLPRQLIRKGAGTRRLTVAAALAATIAACGANAGIEGEVRSHRVDIVRAEQRTIVERIESFGSIAIRGKADVTAAVDGTVRELPFGEGDAVAAGETVAVLENVQLEVRRRQVESEIASAESAVALAEARYDEAAEDVLRRILSLDRREVQRRVAEFDLDYLDERIERTERLRRVGGAAQEELQELYARRVRLRGEYEALLKEIEIESLSLTDDAIAAAGLPVPDDDSQRIAVLQRLNTAIEAAELDVAGSTLESARAEADSVELLIDELTVRAPLGGTVGARHVEVGERVDAGAPVVSILELHPIHALLPVRESEVGLLARGLDARVVVPAATNAVREGAIERIAPIVDARSGNVSVRILLDNADAALRPGMFVRGEIEHGGEREAVAIPGSTLVDRDSSSATLLFVRGGRALKREIELGEELSDGWVEVTEGLTAAELVIDSPSPLIREGDRVYE